jgi:hypothetical protein
MQPERKWGGQPAMCCDVLHGHEKWAAHLTQCWTTEAAFVQCCAPFICCHVHVPCVSLLRLCGAEPHSLMQSGVHHAISSVV